MKTGQTANQRPDADAPALGGVQQSTGSAGEPGDSFRDSFHETSYYSTGRDWDDYAPAYRYGYRAFAHHRDVHARFEEHESELEQHWGEARDQSRLFWAEARNAVRDAWQRAEVEASRPLAAAVASVKPVW